MQKKEHGSNHCFLWADNSCILTNNRTIAVFVSLTLVTDRLPLFLKTNRRAPLRQEGRLCFGVPTCLSLERQATLQLLQCNTMQSYIAPFIVINHKGWHVETTPRNEGNQVLRWERNDILKIMDELDISWKTLLSRMGLDYWKLPPWERAKLKGRAIWWPYLQWEYRTAAYHTGNQVLWLFRAL